MENWKFSKFKEFLMEGDVEGVINHLENYFIEEVIDESCGWRPIHRACFYGNNDIVKLLIEKKCNIESEDKYGCRPIHCACQKGHTNIVKLLIDNNCDIESQDKSGWRAIHHACSYGHVDILKLLIQEMCNIESEDIYRWKPIHCACERGHLEIVQLLIDENCNIESEDKHKKKPIQQAHENGHTDIVILLTKFKAQSEAKASASNVRFVSEYNKDFEHIGCLGKGAFGVVFEARNRFDQNKYAVKRIYFRKRKDQSKMLKEVQLFSTLEHPGIARYYHAWLEYPPSGWRKMKDREMGYSDSDSNSDDETKCLSGSDWCPLTNTIKDRDAGDQCSHIYLHIKMQLYKSKSLKEWLENHKLQSTMRTKLLIFVQIVDAVAYIHGRGLIHRDLKPSNIMFDDENHVRIVDFGLATSLSRCKEIRTTSSNSVPMAATEEYLSINEKHENQIISLKSRTSNVGTIWYMSPEQHGCNYDEKVDVFALGMIFIELIVPFKNKQECFNVLREVKIGRFDAEIFRPFPKEKEFAARLLHHDPKMRPNCKEVLKHEILAEVVREAASKGMVSMKSLNLPSIPSYL